MANSNKESNLRSIMKAISWRLIATATTFTLAMIVFGESEDALEKSSQIAGLELFIKLALYYLHERGWQMLPVGSVRKMFKK